MNAIHIIPATPSDVLTLQSIGRQTFLETFGASNTEANMLKYLEESFSAEKLTAELAHPDSSFYFAIANEHVVGYLKLNIGVSPSQQPDSQALEIERIYVLQAFHGQQVGQLLYEKALSVAAELQAKYIWLGVWEQNPRAIRFYEKNGFVAFDKHIFKLGEDEQTDILMKRSLA